MKIAFRFVPFTAAQMEQLSAIAASNGAETVWLDDDSPDPSLLSDCDALMGYFPPQLIPSLPHLKWVQLPCAGADRFCRFIPEGVTLTNCSGAFGTSIAEYCVCTLIMMFRKLPAYLQQQNDRNWNRLDSQKTINGSRITVIGAGNLGQSVATRMKALGAHVTGVRRSVSLSMPESFDELLPVSSIEDAVHGSDAVILCLPETPETRTLISASVIAAMAPDAILINCGRGTTVDQAALTQALVNEKLGGAVLDVFEQEPLPADNLLWTLPNVLVTPHISGRDTDPFNVRIIFDIFSRNLSAFLEHRPLTHIVDCRRGY